MLSSVELIDIVNGWDEVVGTATFDEVYEKRLFHRIVHIFLFNAQGEIALQKRSVKKKFCPGYWSTAVGGHVQSGETPEEAALREGQEELGKRLPITFAHKDFYEDAAGNKKWLSTFNAPYDGPFDLNPEEVEEVRYFSKQQIQEMIDCGEKFHPELEFLLKKYYLA